jgi:hypothetical protein
MTKYLSLLIVVCGVITGELQAQEASRGVSITTIFGKYLPTVDLGFGRGDEGADYIALRSGAAVGVQVDGPIGRSFGRASGSAGFTQAFPS